MEPTELAAAVAARYQEQATAYRSLLDLARRIKGHLVAGETDQVQGLLPQQLELMATVDLAGEALTPLRRQLGAAYGHPDVTLALVESLDHPAPPLKQAGEAMRQVADLLQELSALYAENQKLLTERLGAVRSEQGALARGKSAVQAYRGPGSDESRFIDKKS